MDIYEDYRKTMGATIDANTDGMATIAQELVTDLQAHLADNADPIAKASTIIEVTRYYLRRMERVERAMEVCQAKYQAITFAIEHKEES